MRIMDCSSDVCSSDLLPTVDYQANANSLAVNDIVVERLSLAGKARVDADQIIIPVAGRAARIRGLDTVAGGTLVQVRLDGDLAYADGRILSDNLRLRDRKSTRLNSSH